MSRHALLGILAALVPACATTDEDVASTEQALNSDYTLMQIVAHEDDDTLFMNPDMQNFIGAGYTSVTVVTTAGEAEGTVGGGAPCGAISPGQDRAHFAAARQSGMRGAYAQMAGVANTWNRTSLLFNGRLLEVDSLAGAPQVKLVFMNLPEDGDSSAVEACGGPLGCLFFNDAPGSCAGNPASWCTTTVTGTTGGIYSYNRAQFIQTLASVITYYHPNVVRLPDPEPLVISCPPGAEVGCSSFDNVDHTATSRLGNEALQAYSGTYTTQYYKGYQVANHEGNLGTNEYSRKRGAFERYMYPTTGGPNPGGACDSPSDSYDHCGDTNAAFFVCDQNYNGDYLGYWAWYGATYERYPNSTSWLTRLSDGKLAAFAVQRRQVTFRMETASESTWTSPLTLTSTYPVAPHVSSVLDATGNLTVFALQLTPGASDPRTGPGPDVIYNTRNATTGAWSGWTSLGNPSADPWGIGAPVAAIDGAGHMVVFVRDSNGGVSMRYSSGATFSAWTAMPGLWDPYVAFEDLEAITADDGSVHVFTSTLEGFIVHWTQTGTSATFTVDAGGFPAASPVYDAAGPITATKNADGRLQVFWHGAGYADVMSAYQDGAGGWPIVSLGNTGTGGLGPIAAIRHADTGRIMLFARNGYGGISANWQIAPNDIFNGWTDLGNQFPSFPSAATNAKGAYVIAGLGVNGNLMTNRESYWTFRNLRFNSFGTFTGWLSY